MSKFCFKCGKELEDDVKFCSACGQDQALAKDSSNNSETAEDNDNASSSIENVTSNNKTSKPIVENRSIALAIVLSIVTCGIYSIYWYISMVDDANKVSNELDSTSGGLTLLYSILTCGIYKMYWAYKAGKQLYNAGKIHGKDIADNSVLYLVLSLVGLSIISDALIQNDLNSFSN